MKYFFHPQAETEFLEAVDYYEQLEPGLGQDFALEIHGAIAAIVAYPHAWPTLGEDIHRCLVHRFPYGVLYAIEPTGISIVAVMHLHRHPDYWRSRR